MKAKLKLILASLVLISVIGACGDDENGNGGGSRSDLSYNYEENGCSTGKQSFTSKEAYCEGLRSASRNKNCAYNLRKMDYEQNCGGSFSEN